MDSEPEQIPPPPIPPRIPPVQPGVVWGRVDLLLDSGGSIDGDVNCKQCGYNLRGLDPAERCPECGLAIDMSLRSDLLQLSEPNWVARLARGGMTAAIGVLLVVLFSIASPIVMFTVAGISMGAAGGGAAPPIDLTSVAVIMSALGIGIALVPVLGVWWITTPEPGTAERDDGPLLTARTLARWCAMAQLLSIPLLTFGAADTPGWNTPTGVGIGPAYIPLMISGQVLSGVVLVGYAAGLIYLSRLAVRAGKQSIKTQCKIVLWGYIPCAGFSLVTGIAQTFLLSAAMAGMMGGGTGPGGGMGPAMMALSMLGIGNCFAVLGQLIFGIWALVLLFILASAFRKALIAARAKWGEVAELKVES